MMDGAGAADLRRQYGMVYRFVRRHSVSREQAEDLTQDVFEAAIAALGEARLEANGAPLAWLYTVARHRLIDRVRARTQRSVEIDPDELPSTASELRYSSVIVGAVVD